MFLGAIFGSHPGKKTVGMGTHARLWVLAAQKRRDKMPGMLSTDVCAELFGLKTWLLGSILLHVCLLWFSG